MKSKFVCADLGRSHCASIQAAAIHFEKVARKEIGAFTTPKNRTRSKLMTPPPSGKEPEKGYKRVPISYSVLDSVGHCFHVRGFQNWEAELSSHTFRDFLKIKAEWRTKFPSFPRSRVVCKGLLLIYLPCAGH